MVRKKQRMMSSAIAVRNMKLERVSKPSQLDSTASGSGNMAIKRKTNGKRSQAIELLMEIVFLLSRKTIMISNTIAAIDISI